MKIYRIVPMIFLVALSVRADIVLPITHGEADIFGHGFGSGGRFFTAEQEISISGPGFSFLGGGPIAACTTALPCTPGATFQSSWLSGSIGFEDFVYQGTFFMPYFPTPPGTFIDFNYMFSSFVLRARNPALDGVDDIIAVGGLPFTAVGHFQSPTVLGGQPFVFVGQGTVLLALNADGPNWDLQFARFDFTAAPEPSFFSPLAMALMVGVNIARRGRKQRRRREVTRPTSGEIANLC